MNAAANPARGECGLRVDGCDLVLRPSFAALVAAEGELGPLFALVERAVEGRLTIVPSFLSHRTGTVTRPV